MPIGDHIHHQYDNELESVRSRVLAMGGLVERQIGDAIAALVQNNSELAEYVVRTDHRVNGQEVGIDEDCTYILARRQPAATDLRLVMAIIKTITDLERMGDESEKIARMAIGESLQILPGADDLLNRVEAMGALVLQLLRDVLDAFVRMDIEAGLTAARRDEDIDRHYVALITAVQDQIKNTPEETEQYQRLIWVARSLERIGDHSKNIAEYVVYLVKGKDVRHISIDTVEQELSA